MSEDEVRRVLAEAFGVWGAVTPLTFREVINERADIVVDFNRYWHSDDLPFDGPGGILAHAFFPRTLEDGQPDACRTSFDAVSMIRGEPFFFWSRYVWRIRDGRLQGGYPALSSRHWRGIPDSIDAAHEDKSGNIWFCQGDSYWVFDAGRRISGPESLRRLGLPVSGGATPDFI